MHFSTLFYTSTLTFDNSLTDMKIQAFNFNFNFVYLQRVLILNTSIYNYRESSVIFLRDPFPLVGSFDGKITTDSVQDDSSCQTQTLYHDILWLSIVGGFKGDQSWSIFQVTPLHSATLLKKYVYFFSIWNCKLSWNKC